MTKANSYIVPVLGDFTEYNPSHTLHQMTKFQYVSFSSEV